MYHFIRIQDLANVFRRSGLCCAKDLRAWGDTFDDNRQKWGNTQKGEALSGYVSCSVNRPWGMLGKAGEKHVVIGLKPDVAAAEDVAYIGKWSSFRDVDSATAIRQKGVEWFDRMFLHPEHNIASPHPGEFLVPGHIPLAAFDRLVFYSEGDRDEAIAKLEGVPNPSGVTLRAMVHAGTFGRTRPE